MTVQEAGETVFHRDMDASVRHGAAQEREGGCRENRVAQRPEPDQYDARVGSEA